MKIFAKKASRAVGMTCDEDSTPKILLKAAYVIKLN